MRKHCRFSHYPASPVLWTTRRQIAWVQMRLTKTIHPNSITLISPSIKSRCLTMSRAFFELPMHRNKLDMWEHWMANTHTPNLQGTQHSRPDMTHQCLVQLVHEVNPQKVRQPHTHVVSVSEQILPWPPMHTLRSRHVQRTRRASNDDAACDQPENVIAVWRYFISREHSSKNYAFMLNLPIWCQKCYSIKSGVASIRT